MQARKHFPLYEVDGRGGGVSRLVMVWCKTRNMVRIFKTNMLAWHFLNKERFYDFYTAF